MSAMVPPDKYILACMLHIHNTREFSVIPDLVIRYMDYFGYLDHEPRDDGTTTILPKLSLRGQLVASVANHTN